jgi:WD40 repeat protein
MYTLDAVGAFAIGHPPETYIYDIQPLADGVAAISSDNCLRLIDPLVLHGPPLQVVQNVHTDVTCLKVLDADSSIVCTAGRDGRINIFDFRAKSKVAEVRTGRNAVISCVKMVCSSGSNLHKNSIAKYEPLFDCGFSIFALTVGRRFPNPTSRRGHVQCQSEVESSP